MLGCSAAPGQAVEIKSSSFSPGPSCKLSNQYIIQDHMAAHFKKLISAKAAVDSSAPKSLHTSVKHKDQQKRDRLIQTLEKYEKDLVHGLPATPFNSRSVSPSQQKMRRPLLENGHPYLTSGRNNSSGTKREQPPSISFQKFTSRPLMPAPAARKSIPNSAPCALSQTPVHGSGTDRLSASLRLPSHEHLGSRNTKKVFQNSVHKTYSGDLLDKHSVYFTEKKQCFNPRILKTSHQSFLVKYRYYNPPSRRRSSSPSRPSFKSSDINNQKKSELHRFIEDSHMRPHSVHFSQQPVENHELWIQNSEMPLFPELQLEEKEEEYLRFLQDLTNDILIGSCYHREVLEDVFQIHIKSKRHNLDEGVRLLIPALRGI
ncbi:spermatogenesis-associated protein 7 homolog isoform X2 [Empidonax traillii]|uniref:spermatogenesis-associated protein 7 homolog isoform X2 n=1 Tax=Empidonax traillii TaxID=164674 RepID=UPI000FFD9338|nr:spermatogenesis-associated protein 7 homolog isoform X2 [Empidonax traillii]